MLMSEILSENAADKEIIKSLLRHIKLLSGRKTMSTEAKILFDINGDAYRATEFEVLSEDELNRELAEAKAEATKLEDAIAYSNKLQGGITTPVADTPAPENETPVVDEPTTPVAQEAPVQPEAPSVPDATVSPFPVSQDQVATDPATAPAPVAPIVLS